jgi:hypothetical protein
MSSPDNTIGHPRPHRASPSTVAVYAEDFKDLDGLAFLTVAAIARHVEGRLSVERIRLQEGLGG